MFLTKELKKKCAAFSNNRFNPYFTNKQIDGFLTVASQIRFQGIGRRYEGVE
jgi:hypothetical protein